MSQTETHKRLVEPVLMLSPPGPLADRARDMAAPSGSDRGEVPRWEGRLECKEASASKQAAGWNAAEFVFFFFFGCLSLSPSVLVRTCSRPPTRLSAAACFRDLNGCCWLLLPHATAF